MMLIAHELHMTVSQLQESMDMEELGWWLAYFKVKIKREEAARRKRASKSKTPLSNLD